MNRRREESMAAALWTYVERAREQEGAAAGLDDLTPADLEQLVALFRTAADLPAALELPAGEGNEVAGDRVRAAIAACAAQRAPRVPLRRRLPRFAPAAARWLATGALALALGAGFAAGRLAGPRPEASAEVALAEKISCREARAKFAALIDGQLPEPEKSAVMWHLAHCGSCLDAYYAARSRHSPPRTAAPGLTARRPAAMVRMARRGTP
jgi:Putative zinc-finger